MQHESFEDRKDIEWLNRNKPKGWIGKVETNIKLHPPIWQNNPRKVIPLTGQVLVELLPHDKFSQGGIEIPQRSLSPEEVQDRHLNPEKPKPWFGTVRAIGKWPKLKGGLTLMPEFGVGARVIIKHNSGTPFQDGTQRKLRMVPQSQVLAVLM